MSDPVEDLWDDDFDADDTSPVEQDLNVGASRRDLSAQRATLAQNRRIRAQAQADLVTGRRSLRDIIMEACTEQGRALDSLTLRTLLLSQPGWGRKRVHAVLEHTIDMAHPHLNDRRITVASMLDRRTSGRRWYAFWDATTPRELPWPGFPMKGAPDELR